MIIVGGRHGTRLEKVRYNLMIYVGINIAPTQYFSIRSASKICLRAPKGISKTRRNTSMHMTHLLIVNSHGRFDKEMSQRLKVLTQWSFSASNSALSIQIPHTIAQIELLDSQLEIIETEMTDIMKINNSVNLSTSCIDYINAKKILGDIHNIH